MAQNSPSVQSDQNDYSGSHQSSQHSENDIEDHSNHNSLKNISDLGYPKQQKNELLHIGSQFDEFPHDAQAPAYHGPKQEHRPVPSTHSGECANHSTGNRNSAQIPATIGHYSTRPRRKYDKRRASARNDFLLPRTTTHGPPTTHGGYNSNDPENPMLRRYIDQFHKQDMWNHVHVANEPVATATTTGNNDEQADPGPRL